MKLIKNITGMMVNDHTVLIELFNDFKSIKHKDNKKARELFSRINAQLQTHIKSEEKIINSLACITTNMNQIIKSIRSDHERILSILRQIFGSIKNDLIVDTSDLYLILRHHMNIEECFFYPELDEFLSEKEKILLIENIKREY